MQLKYRKLTKKEEDTALIKIIDTLLDPSLPYSGKHRLKQWEKGWEENYKEGTLSPHYFGKYPVNRLNGKFVIALSKDYEKQKLYQVIDSVFKKYLKKTTTIYEFGCGTGHNLLRISAINKEAKLIGLDWAESSQKILEEINIEAHNFDFFKPNYKIKLAKDSAVYTVAALEQTGTNYKKFVSYLLRNKPAICIHIEPIAELLNKTKLLDYLSIKYFEKRKYLSGYLDYLRKLEKEKKIKIIEAKRSGVGSLFIEGYSIIVWKPL